MKNIFKIGAAALCCSSMLLTGCIEETFPTNAATDDQVSASSKSLEALLWAMPAFLNNFATLSSDYAYDWGYGSMMHIRDVMGEDMAVAESSYDWYTSWAQNKNNGEQYASTQFIWNYYWKLVQTTNNVVKAIDPETASETNLGYLGIGHAFRAFAYLDMARMFEFLPNDKVSGINDAGNNVDSLTVPIVTELTTEKEAGNNPRVHRKDMYEFILSDLNIAEANIAKAKRLSKTMPDLAVVYGLKARLYMWVENYDSARVYARKAINLGGYRPTTEAEWVNTTSGFNDLATASWMWGAQQMKEDDVVQTGILNWTSWASNETTYGYASAGPMTMAGVAFYEKISNSDFRKLSWKAPAGSYLDGKNSYIDEELAEDIPEYGSLKFRPASGNISDYNVGSASAYPLMRIEEMYFIEAEAAAHADAAEGKALIESFMKGYRDPKYSCMASEKADVISEIFFQKRVEFWGEGLNFFDYKRLNMPVTRAYEGSNFASLGQFNTTTRPAWMNIAIVRSEKNSNKALMGYENPSTADCYK